jgi:uncharacterized membrane protein
MPSDRPNCRSARGPPVAVRSRLLTRSGIEPTLDRDLVEVEADAEAGSGVGAEPSDSGGAGAALTPRVLIVLAALGVLANVEAMAGLHVGTVGPLAGLCFFLLAPTLMLRSLLWSGLESVARTVVAFALVLLGLMVLGLLVNFVLPVLGDKRPLAPVPLVLFLDVVVIALAVRCQRRGRPQDLRRTSRPGRPRSRLVTLTVVGACLSVALAAMGAVRLNNNGGDAVGNISLALVCVLAAVLLWGGPRFTVGQVAFVLFGMGAAILLLSAMRGWFITGPDSLDEYALFRTVETAARWSPRTVDTPYNACLSITILPQVLVSITGVSGVWVWKTIFPLCFSVTPVYVFLIAKSVAGRRTAILAALVFLAFPAFVYSLTFAARQEIGFVFVGAAVVVMRARAGRERVGLVALLFLGMVLSHYSTVYYFWAMGAVGYVTFHLFRSVFEGRLGRSRRLGRHGVERDREDIYGKRPSYILSLRGLLLMLAFLLLWEGPINGITGHLQNVMSSAYHDVVGGGSQTAAPPPHPGDGVRVTGPASLRDLAATDEATASVANDGFYSQSFLNHYEASSRVALNDLPDTRLGGWIDELGVSPGRLNRGFRTLIAAGLEVLSVVGVIGVLVRRRRKDLELVSFGLGNLVVVASIFLLPSLTVNYGASRGFQEALFVLAPFVAIGLVRGLATLRVPHSREVAGGVAIASMASLVGLLPQLTGGYTAQVDLNNSGIFYADYYTTTEEMAAVQWLNGHPALALQMNPYLADQILTMTRQPLIPDDFPDVLRRNATLVLGTTTTATGADLYGTQLTWDWPTGLLPQLKSRVYASEGASVYK